TGMINSSVEPVMASIMKRSIAGDLHLADIPAILVFTASGICSGAQCRNFNLNHISPTPVRRPGYPR
ncbi:MAG: hypothetical protein AB2637_02360, partial [Candidatus Thiodiazotropha sp.]